MQLKDGQLKQNTGTMDAKWPAEQTVMVPLEAKSVAHVGEGTTAQRTVQQKDRNARNLTHFARVYRTNTQQKQATFKSKKVHTVSDCAEHSPPELFIGRITKLHANTAREQAFAEIEIGKAK